VIPDHDEAVRIRIRKRLEQDAIHDREDRAAGANADGEREERRGGEHRRPARQSQRESKVVPQFVEQPPATNLAARLIHLCDAAELQARPPLGLRARNPCAT
jgi:hypothetical protein